jgi:hypothetical protein
MHVKKSKKYFTSLWFEVRGFGSKSACEKFKGNILQDRVFKFMFLEVKVHVKSQRNILQLVLPLVVSSPWFWRPMVFAKV